MRSWTASASSRSSFPLSSARWVNSPYSEPPYGQGGTEAREAPQTPEQALLDHPAPVDLQLHAVFACVALRPLKAQHQPSINERRAFLPDVEHSGHLGHARREGVRSSRREGFAARECEGGAAESARHSEDGHPRPAEPAREGEDGGVVGCEGAEGEAPFNCVSYHLIRQAADSFFRCSHPTRLTCRGALCSEG